MSPIRVEFDHRGNRLCAIASRRGFRVLLFLVKAAPGVSRWMKKGWAFRTHMRAPGRCKRGKRKEKTGRRCFQLKLGASTIHNLAVKWKASSANMGRRMRGLLNKHERMRGSATREQEADIRSLIPPTPPESSTPHAAPIPRQRRFKPTTKRTDATPRTYLRVGTRVRACRERGEG